MVALTKLNLIAQDFHYNNSFMTIILALSKQDLSLLTIGKTENQVFYSELSTSEQDELFSIMLKLCEKKAQNT